MGQHTIEINTENFKEKVVDSGRSVIVDLWAEWCMPCKMIAPMVEEIAKDHKDKIDVGKINVDDSPQLATELSVMNIPTLLFYKKGKEAGRLVGVNNREYVEEKIKEFFG